MNDRIKRLREQSLSAINTLSAERALLVTRFYGKPEVRSMSVPVQRARCFEYIMQNKSLCITDDELIVGERGPAPKATPTYPEVNVHSIKDLEILNDRQKVSFTSDAETRRSFADEIIPFWKGMTNRDRMMELLPAEWHKAYSAGMFTEFMEQRAPGHTVLGDKIYRMGMLDIISEIESVTGKLDFFNDSNALEKQEELKAMKIAAMAIIGYAGRNADLLDKLASSEIKEERKKELQQMAHICRRVPAHAPETFHEALQYYWFIHLGVITELNPWDSFNPGRLDQHLYPFYKRELTEGTLDRERAEELLQAFWIKFNNHPAPPKVGVTAQESNTYTDFSLINTGGLKADGTDGVNELSYLILDVIEEMRLLQPSSMVQVSKKTPDRFVHRALNIVKTGFGQPSVFNTDAILQELMRQGKSIEDARRGGASGCVESGAFGTECYILTGYLNLPKILEVMLNRGTDPRSGEIIGLDTGDPESFSDFEQLLTAYEKQIRYFADIKIKGSNLIEKLFATRLPAPFLSLLIDDCIPKGQDYNAGGARYNTNYIQCVGMGTVTDCLTSLRLHAFDKKDIPMKTMLQALSADFKGFDEIRWSLVYDTPKYGNDDEYADRQLTQTFEMVYNAINGRPSPRGATYRINLLPTTCHIYFGAVTGALPDGRKAGDPVSEGVSPVQGADRKGPTAVIKSVAKIDHLRTGGTLLNQKFTPSFFRNSESIEKLGYLIRSYFRLDGHHIQFNVVSADTLREAQKHPEKYRDLIVRVAGYSDYFNDLGEDLQNEIINRTEHETV